MNKTMSKLDALESQSVYILREAYREFKSLVMLWSIGKDSTVLLWLARKAFLGHVPFPLVHIDTSFKIPEMIEYRDRLAREWKLNMIVGQNKQALAEGRTFPAGKLDRINKPGRGILNFSQFVFNRDVVEDNKRVKYLISS